MRTRAVLRLSTLIRYFDLAGWSSPEEEGERTFALCRSPTELSIERYAAEAIVEGGIQRVASEYRGLRLFAMSASISDTRELSGNKLPKSRGMCEHL